jgi:hypothetical protein
MKIQQIDKKNIELCYFRRHKAKKILLWLWKELNRLCPVSLTVHVWLWRGGGLSVPHISNLTYHFACRSRTISISVLGVGGYPLKLKKLKTACRIKLYRSVTWGVSTPTIATDGSVHRPPPPPHPPGSLHPFQNAAESCQAPRGLLLSLESLGVGGLGCGKRGEFVAQLRYIEFCRDFIIP